MGGHGDPPLHRNGIELSIYMQNSFAPPDAPRVHRMIAYGKRTPEGRSAAIGKRENKKEALKGLRKGRIHMPWPLPCEHPHAYERGFAPAGGELYQYNTSGRFFLRRSYRASCIVWHRVTYGIARRSASLSHRLSYDAPLVRNSRSSRSTGRRTRCGLPSSAGEG